MGRWNLNQPDQKHSLIPSFMVVLAGCLVVTLITLNGTGFLRQTAWNNRLDDLVIFTVLLFFVNLTCASLITILVIRLSPHQNLNELYDQDIHSQLEQAPLAVLVIDQDGKILYTNTFVTNLFGYTETELIGQNVGLLISETTRPTNANQRAQINTRPTNRQMGMNPNLVALHKNQMTFPVDVAFSSIRTKRGVSTMCYIQDITERKRSESLLRESEAKYRSLYQNGLVGIFRAAYQDGCIQEANHAFLEMFGYKEISELPLENLYASQEDYQRILELLELGGDFHDFNVCCQRLDGTTFWASMSAILFKEMGFIEGALIDVDKRVSTERELAHSLSLLQATLESSNEGILAVDRQPKPVYYNRHFLTLWGFKQTDVDAKPADILTPKMASQLNSPQEFISRIEGIYHHPELGSYDKVRLKDGRIYEISSKPQKIGSEIVGRVWITRDITQRTNSETTLQTALAETRQSSSALSKMVNELEKRAQETSLLHEMGDLLQICNTMDEAYAIISRYTVKLFPQASGLLGILSSSRNSVEVVVSWREPSVIDLVFPSVTCWALRRAHLHTEDGGQVVNLCQHMKTTDTIPYLCIPMLAHGELLGLLHVQYKQISDADKAQPNEFNLLEKSNISLAVSLAERVSLALSNLHLRETLREQAIRDPLTGLFNRRFMQESLEREVRRSIRTKTPLAALLFDIDHFKLYNDSYGHEAGDLLLHEAGKLLLRSVRTEDIVCRYGGEEFVIIMPGSSLTDAVRRAEQIREKIGKIEINYESQKLGKITISLGVATLSKRNPDGETLLRQADDAMYQAKAAGRNQVMYMKEDE